MKFFIVVVASSLCFQIAVCGKTQKESASRSSEDGGRMFRGNIDLFQRAAESPVAKAQGTRKPSVMTYYEAQKQLDAERIRARQDRHDYREDGFDDGSSSREAPSGEPKVLSYHNKIPRKLSKVVGRSRNARKSMAALKSISESHRKRQQLLFGLNYVKGMMADPHMLASLKSWTRVKFAKELHRVEAEIKSSAWDEINQHQNNQTAAVAEDETYEDT